MLRTSLYISEQLDKRIQQMAIVMRKNRNDIVIQALRLGLNKVNKQPLEKESKS